MILAPEAPQSIDGAVPKARRGPGRIRSALRRDLETSSTWPVLDSVRGATVLAVVGWHVYRLTATGVTRHAVPFYFWPLGALRLGVDVFFVLSGFLVIRSWKAARRAASSTGRALVVYARRRSRRILPAYWCSLVVLIALTARPVLRNPRHVLAFVSLNEYVRFWLPGKVNVVYWSLTVEWHFYLLVPLIAWLMARMGRWPMLFGCLGLSFMWWSHTPPMHLPQGFIFGHLDQFVAGAIVGELVVSHASGVSATIVRIARHPAFGIAVACALLSLGAYHGSTLGASRGNDFDPLLHPLFGLSAAAGVLHLLTRPHQAWLEHRALRALGMISFSLYLWHYPILAHGLPWAMGIAPLPTVVWLPLVIVAFVGLAFVVATLSYLIVERPFVVNAASSKHSYAPQEAALALVTTAAS